MRTAADKLSEAINKILTEYAEDVTKDVDAVAVKLAQKGAAVLRAKAGETFKPKAGGRYAKSWTYTTEKTRTGTTVTIYSKVPGLPHLLENGHVSRNGTGRTFGTVQGREHIRPVADELEQTFEKEVLGKL